MVSLIINFNFIKMMLAGLKQQMDIIQHKFNIY